MDSMHPIPDPTKHPDFHEHGHWITDGLALVDMVLVGILIVAAVTAFWWALAWVVFER